jgi:hypothetical protein
MKGKKRMKDINNYIEEENENVIVPSASQGMNRLLWNPKVHYRVHKSQSPAAILSHMNPVHTFLT